MCTIVVWVSFMAVLTTLPTDVRINVIHFFFVPGLREISFDCECFRRGIFDTGVASVIATGVTSRNNTVSGRLRAISA